MLGFVKRIISRAALAFALTRSKLDHARTTPENRNHWVQADGLSADAWTTPEARSKVRNRSRHEVFHNSWAKGITLTLANDMCGRGPRLQMLLENEDLNDRVEEVFSGWMRATGLARKVWQMRLDRAVVGEGFGVLIQNKKIDHQVKIDVRLYEADQFATPEMPLKDNAIDGIEFDESGNPKTYHLLKYHPGDTRVLGFTSEKEDIDAENVFHHFRADRTGQSRGLPDIYPSLGLFAELRRYSNAVIAAAETAADHAGVVPR